MKSTFEKNLQNGVEYFTSSKLSQQKTRHFFSTRIGGKSKEPYASLNLGIYTDDDPDNIVENFILIGEAANINMDELVYLNQVHSDEVLVADENNMEDISGSDADAIITRCRNISIGVFTADCVPILIHDEENEIIAAVHAGWKGTAAGIVSKTIRHMIENMNSKPSNIKVAIGPSIGACCFEVEEDVAFKFASKNQQNGKWHVDLADENYKQLIGCGIPEGNIDVSALCTKCDEQLFYSYRRDKGKTGRMCAFIELI